MGIPRGRNLLCFTRKQTCVGEENWSRSFDPRAAGGLPFCATKLWPHLEQVKDSGEFVVIDHIERPSDK